MKSARGEFLEMVVEDIETDPVEDGYYPLRLITTRGVIECRYYQVSGAQKGAIWVGGVGGNWDTPASELYPRLCQELTGEAIASLRIKYRYPTILEEAVLDVLAGLSFLEAEGITAAALTGHSFGGAVVIQAAAHSPSVRTVAALSTQSYGAAVAPQLAPRCSLLLVHGRADEVLPPSCSEYVYHLAGEPKHLLLYPNARHGLDEVAEEVRHVIRDWTVGQLSAVVA